MGFFDDLADTGKETLQRVGDAAGDAATDALRRQIDDWFRGGEFGTTTFPQPILIDGTEAPSTDEAGAPATTAAGLAVDPVMIGVLGLILVLALR